MSSEPKSLFTKAGDNKPAYSEGVKDYTQKILKSYLDFFCKKFTSNISSYRYFNLEIKGVQYPLIDSIVEDDKFKNVSFRITTGDPDKYNSLNSRLWVYRIKEAKWYWCNYNIIEQKDINKDILFYYILNDDYKINELYTNREVFIDTFQKKILDPFSNFPFDLSGIISK